MLILKDYHPHEGQLAFHTGIEQLWQFVLMLCGIRGGKTYAGAREALKQCWNSDVDIHAPYGIIAPTFSMLERTTWREFKIAAEPLIEYENKVEKIIRLKNGREVFGFTAERADHIRNVTLMGFWVDEARECKDFAALWDILLGRVLSTNGKGIVTSSPNSFDGLHEVFFEKRQKDYGVITFNTYENTYIPAEAISSLAAKYDEKFAEQEIGGKFVVFQGSVYYAFDRRCNAGDLAFKLAQYDPKKPIQLCCDFNVDPMSWVIAQFGQNDEGLREVYFIDEICLRNSNTPECCDEFKERYPNHEAGVVLHGDASGSRRDTRSHVSDWRIIQDELRGYGITYKVPHANPSEKDRINAVNAMLKNSQGKRRIFVNPKKCPKLIGDFEQVPYKKGSTQIDKSNQLLTHPSDAAGYMVETEFSIARSRIEGLKI